MAVGCHSVASGDKFSVDGLLAWGMGADRREVCAWETLLRDTEICLRRSAGFAGMRRVYGGFRYLSQLLTAPRWRVKSSRFLASFSTLFGHPSGNSRAVIGGISRVATYQGPALRQALGKSNPALCVRVGRKCDDRLGAEWIAGRACESEAKLHGSRMAPDVGRILRNLSLRWEAWREGIGIHGWAEAGVTSGVSGAQCDKAWDALMAAHGMRGRSNKI